MSPPQWIASTGESDPAGYLDGATPALYNVVITRPDGFTGSATLRIVEASGLLVFSDTTVPFTSGSATYSYAITSSQAVPSYIDVLYPSLTWSLSIDGGTTFIPFAWTYHNIFVVLGAPSGFVGYTAPDGTVVTPARPNITAARVNYVVTLLSGLSDPDDVAQALQTSVTSLFTPGNGGLDAHFDNNPWEWLDNPYNGYLLDCYSLSEIAAVQLFEAGVGGYLGVAFPTTSGNATQQVHQNYGLSNQLDLQFYSASGKLNKFEAFLAPTASEDAYTLYPAMGPLYPWTTAVSELPSDWLGQVHFTVIYSELDHEQGLGSPGGQQWWVTHFTTPTASSGPIAFPVTLP